MTEYLVFRLYGPLCSWGEIAVGESRHTANHPSRSALLGLFAAALGIERAEEERHQALSEAWRFGVKLVSPGMLLRDYHTVQAPKRQKNVRHRTRRSELLAPELNTLLSTREYRTDSVSVVAAVAASGSEWTAATMAEALRSPRFPLYLGRKSCPPALPLDPQVTGADTLRAALDISWKPFAGLPFALLHSGDDNKTVPQSHTRLGATNALFPAYRDSVKFRIRSVHYFWDDGLTLHGEPNGNGGHIDFVRHDQPLSRRRWQFARRREWGWLAPPSSKPAEAPNEVAGIGIAAQEDAA